MSLSTPGTFSVPDAVADVAVLVAAFAAAADVIVVVVVVVVVNREKYAIEKHADAYNGGGKPLPLLVQNIF